MGNQLYLLPEFDHIVFLDGGRIAAQGTYEELMANNPSFAAMATVHASDHADLDCPVTSDAAKPEHNTTLPKDHISTDIEINVSQSEKADQKDSGKLVEDEARKFGSVGMSIVLEYFKACGGWPYMITSVIIATCAYSIMCIGDLWLAAWVSPSNSLSTSTRALVYVCMSLGQAVLIMSLSSWNALSSFKASKKLHLECVTNILHTQSTWFEKTPSGRIISRFSGDLSLVDRTLSYVSDDLWQFTFLLIGLIVVICFILPEMIIVVCMGMAVYGVGVLAVDRTNREAKRETNNALSDVLTTIGETTNPRSLVHCIKLGALFRARQYSFIDEWNARNYFSCIVVQWGVLLTNTIAFFMAVVASVLVFAQLGSFAPEMIGVALNYLFLLPYFLSIFAVIIMLFANAITSLERLLEYRSDSLPRDPEWHLPKDPILSQWPTAGKVAFKNVALRYRPGLPLAIKDVTATLNAGESIGIVGRTGAGKSSLLTLLFRIVDACEGLMLIDDKDITSVGLHTLRKALAIIPQSPLLISGSVAHNLDPFNVYDMDELTECCGKVGLNLNKLQGDATDLSAGEQQLLALARVLLRIHSANTNSPRIVVLDEPTANIDSQTDEVIQAVIREEMKDCTVITIAHRLNTVITNDNIIVMDQGRIVEYGKPAALLKKPQVHLNAMVAGMGEEISSALRELVEKEA